MLDTVFVVNTSLPYSQANHLRLKLPEAYHHVGIAPLFGESSCSQCEEFRLYEGKSWSHGDLFSFFPCDIESSNRGFPRPSIRLAPYVNPTLKLGIKRAIVTTEQVAAAWHKVVEQVVKANLKLGVCAEMPALADAP